jgi:CelD/BcsL family acetyltransferase involved in cellulose biosynthesis
VAKVHTLNAIEDPRWKAFVQRHPHSSIFHTTEWLTALSRTHGYEPIVYTTSPPAGELTNGVVLCAVRSWLTGKRLVSVPFSDHCDLLVTQQDDLDSILSTLEGSVRDGTWNYFEIRPRHPLAEIHVSLKPCATYLLHSIDLRPSVDDIFARLHKDSHQRKVRRADREGLVYTEGRSEEMLADFYRLHLLTRRRHRLPPQPIEWFRNLMALLGVKLSICSAIHDGRTIGSIITLQHRDTLVYKYGASDVNFHNMGTMPLIFWKVICAGKMAGMKALDLGRTDADNQGLITFKNRLGGDQSTSTYFKSFASRGPDATGSSVVERAKPVFARMPDSMLVTAGRLLYRHIG